MEKGTLQYWIADTVVTVVVIVLLVLTVQHTLIAPFDVVGSSMCDTLNKLDGECQKGKGEKILINVATYFFSDPEKGDIVVFKSPADKNKFLVKRVIAEPGEEVEIRGGDVFVRDVEGRQVKIEEEYLNSRNAGSTDASIFGDNFVYPVVPEGYYFVMGDNRNNSGDSRSCFGGGCQEDVDYFLNEDLIRGKAWFVYWPISSWRKV